MKFLVDMPLTPGLAQWLASEGHDAIHASAVGLSRADDAVIVERARQEGRVLLTADLDYPRLVALSRADSPGLVLFRGGDFAEHAVVVRPKAVLDIVPQEELPRSVVVVEQARIRRRTLPLER